MSRGRQPQEMIFCKYCKGKVTRGSAPYRGANCHTSCAAQQPCNLKIDCGNFHAEVRTDMLSPKKLSKLIKLSVEAAEKEK